MPPPETPLAAASPHEWDAAGYDRVSAPQTRWGATVVPRLDLAGDETVLDAGCGTGRVTEAVAARLPAGRVIALDGSAAMVTQARQRLAAYGGRLGALVADLRRPLPLASACVDAIISTATFHWIPDHASLFRELGRVLRPGGHLVAQCGGPGNIATVLAALRAVAPGEPHPTTYATPEETLNRLAAAGFADAQAWLNPEVTPFASREDLEGFLATVILWPNLKVHDPAGHAAFVARVADQLPACELDYVRLNITARRASR